MNAPNVTTSIPVQSALGTSDGGEEPPQPAYRPAELAHPVLRQTSGSDAPCEDHSSCVDVEPFPGLDVLTIDLGWLRTQLSRAASCVSHRSGRPLQRVSVLIIDDARMSAMHLTYSGEEGTTDVLTFDCSAANPGASIEADIAICIDEAARRAAEFGHHAQHELLLYAVHGLLHCVGFDDHSEHGYEQMHAEEDAILLEIGVGALFRPARADKARDAHRAGGTL